MNKQKEKADEARKKEKFFKVFRFFSHQLFTKLHKFSFRKFAARFSPNTQALCCIYCVRKVVYLLTLFRRCDSIFYVTTDDTPESARRKKLFSNNLLNDVEQIYSVGV
jgi:hypothetical protein